jgi:hypothetical protein
MRNRPPSLSGAVHVTGVSPAVISVGIKPSDRPEIGDDFIQHGWLQDTDAAIRLAQKSPMRKSGRE